MRVVAFMLDLGNLRGGAQGLIDAQQCGGDRIIETKLQAGLNRG